MTIVLIHLTFSPDVTRDLEDKRHILFTTAGLVSARCLPPLVPLAWNPTPLPAPLLDQVRKSHSVTFHFSDFKIESRPAGVWLVPGSSGVDAVTALVSELLEREGTILSDPAATPFIIDRRRAGEPSQEVAGVPPGAIPLAFEPIAADRAASTGAPVLDNSIYNPLTCRTTSAAWLTQTTIQWWVEPWYENCTWSVHYSRRMTVRR